MATGRWRHSPACFLCGAAACRLWTTSEVIIYMLPFIFTNVTQILWCRPDAHKGRIYNVSLSFFFFFPVVEIHQISVTLRWKISIQALHPPLLPSLPSLLPSPLSLLCTGVWSCFLMSSGTSGAITLSPSVVTLCTRCKALLIQRHVCIHSCTPALSSTRPKVNKTTLHLQN